MEKLNKLACEIVENLVDCDGAEPEVVEQYQKWTLKRMDEAFRDLEKRAEAAESKLAERGKQEPTGLLAINTGGGWRIAGEADYIFASEHGFAVSELFTRPAPAADLAKLVPDNDLTRVLDFAKFVIKCVRKNGEYAPLSSQEPNEIDAILRKIEDAGKKHE